MDDNTVRNFMSTAELISATLDVAPESWRDHLQAIRNITSSLELLHTNPDEQERQWQLPLVAMFQRVAYADADNGGVPDIANWCLRQTLTLLQVYPEDVDLLARKSPLLFCGAPLTRAVVGRNWLMRAQRSLARIHQAEGNGSSSGASQGPQLSSSEEQRQATSATLEAEDRLHLPDYVEARGILLPAVEYLKYAVDAARAQGKLTGSLLSTVCLPVIGVSSIH